MGKVTRFGVSLNESLLESFDNLCARRAYRTRSEAIRDLIRTRLIEEEWQTGDKEVAGTLTLVYDHHASNLSQRLTAIQHDFHQHIVTALHVHLDHENCLEIIVLKGSAPLLRSFADQVIATRGVKYGTLNLATTGQDLK